MIELLPALDTAIGLVKKLKEVGNKLKHSELMNLVGDLSLELANMKIGMSDLIEENDGLKRRLASIENADGDPCPSCKQRTFSVQSSEQDKVYGFMGKMRWKYLCASCGFKDEKLVGRLP